MKRWTLAAALAAPLLVSAVGWSQSNATRSSARSTGTIVFRRYFDDQHSWGAVFTVRSDGTGARQITHPARGTVDDQPTPSRDGRLITFGRLPAGAASHVWVVKAVGTGLAPVGSLCRAGTNEQTCPDDANPSFSPNGRQIAFTQSTGTVKHDPSGEDWIQHSALAIMNLDGSGRRVVYQGVPFSGDLNSPVFSPNGKRLVFERHVSGFAKPSGKHAVFVIGVDGSGLRRLTPFTENDGDNPDWSPDGKWILFRSYVDQSSSQSQYFLIRPNGTGKTQITHFPVNTHLASAAFSPDGKSIVFSKGPEGGNIDIFTMRLDGTGVRRITRSPLWDSAPDWGKSP